VYDEINRVTIFGIIIREQSIDGRVEVTRLGVGEEVIEGVDDFLGLGIRETALAEGGAEEIADEASLIIIQGLGAGRRLGCRRGGGDNGRHAEYEERE